MVSLKCIMHFFNNPTAGKPVIARIFPESSIIFKLRPKIVSKLKTQKRLIMFIHFKDKEEGQSGPQVRVLNRLFYFSNKYRSLSRC